MKVSAACFLEKLHLCWHFLCLGSLLTSHDDHASPLRVGNHQAAHFSFAGYLRLKTTDLRFHPVGCAAWTRINAELHHHVTVLDQILAEVGGGFALLRRADR